MPMQSINPATGQITQSFSIWQADQISSALNQVESAQAVWAALGYEQRGQFFRQLAQVFRQNSESYAYLITEEMGKLLREAR